MPRSCIKTSDTVVFGIPRSASSSHTVSCWSLLSAACTCSTFSGVLLVADLPEHGSLSTDSWPSLKFLCHTFICAALIVPKSLLNHLNIFRGGMFKLNSKSDVESLLYFELDGHTVHVLTQWCLPPPLTSTVKSPLFTHTHSSPLSWAVRLHWCHANCSRCVNNGWTFSGETSDMYLYIYIYI